LKKHFVIAGLPRSGTAWIANFLSHQPGIFCWHEAIQHGDKFPSYEAVMNAPSAPIVGETTTCTVPNEAYDKLEGQRIWISRNQYDCKADYERCIGRTDWPKIIDSAKKWIARHDPVFVDFGDLFSTDEETAKKAASYLLSLVSDEPMDENAWLLCRQLQIQIFGLSATYYDGRTIITS
jgi:hypothetical protein